MKLSKNLSTMLAFRASSFEVSRWKIEGRKKRVLESIKSFIHGKYLYFFLLVSMTFFSLDYALEWSEWDALVMLTRILHKINEEAKKRG